MGMIILLSLMKLRILWIKDINSYSVGAKIYGKKGNSPEQKLRCLKHNVVNKEVKKCRYPGGGHGSCHPLNKA